MYNGSYYCLCLTKIGNLVTNHYARYCMFHSPNALSMANFKRKLVMEIFFNWSSEKHPIKLDAHLRESVIKSALMIIFSFLIFSIFLAKLESQSRAVCLPSFQLLSFHHLPLFLKLFPIDSYYDAFWVIGWILSSSISSWRKIDSIFFKSLLS